MIDIHLLEHLVAFDTCGTLSAAAEKLYTSQPALTRSMKKLEEELGLSLFNRSKNHLSLNETGQMAAQYARVVLEADREFVDKVRLFDRSLHTLSIGYCAPIPQQVLTPLINDLFEGMTISADMGDDIDFLQKLEKRLYQLAVVHEKPEGEGFVSKKCGHEDLFLAVPPGHPLAFYPQIHLKDLEGLSVLLLSRIGFWDRVHREKTPGTKYLLQVEMDSFQELAQNSSFPVFWSSFYQRRGEIPEGRVLVPIADEESHTDYYLVCLAGEEERYKKLFEQVHETRIW